MYLNSNILQRNFKLNMHLEWRWNKYTVFSIESSCQIFWMDFKLNTVFETDEDTGIEIFDNEVALKGCVKKYDC